MMRARTLGALMTTALLIACGIDRKSDTIACTTTPDCAAIGGNRQCVEGYCVVPNCPADCTSCNEAQRTCQIACTSTNDCGSVTCPSGWSCTVTCSGDGACNDVTCNAGSRCNITCTGSGACNDIDCSDACQCDLTCASGACDAKLCPSRGNGANQVQCTSDGSTGSVCDSSRAASCASC